MVFRFPDFMTAKAGAYRNGQAVISSWFIFPWFIYNGIFACFLQGRCTFLLARTSRSPQIRARVEEGWMMSSTNPGEAQERKRITCCPPSPHVVLSVGTAFWGRQCAWGPGRHKRGLVLRTSPRPQEPPVPLAGPKLAQKHSARKGKCDPSSILSRWNLVGNKMKKVHFYFWKLTTVIRPILCIRPSCHFTLPLFPSGSGLYFRTWPCKLLWPIECSKSNIATSTPRPQGTFFPLSPSCCPQDTPQGSVDSPPKE